MTQTEQIAAANEFAGFWENKGDEKQESQRFWIDLLQNVLGVTNPAKYIEFEKRVQLSHTSYIDAYIADTKVLIEQKGIKIDLHKAYEQSDGAVLTPFEQAKRYVSEMKASEKPRWIVVCNFAEFLIYDLENPQDEPQQIFLKDLPKEFYRLQFLVDQKNENIRREEEISIEAGKLVDKLYQALLPQYKNQDEKSLRSLNILCVRIVFCLYAEDAGLFETRTSFEDYIRGFNLPNVRKGLIELFKALDTKIADRDEYDENLKPFPYVNGGLFKDENIEIPNFTQEIVDVIVNDCAVFDWRKISPTIFGAVFESTLNPETRRKGGMHYTSIENIHKVIDPLFMDDLNAEFDAICATKVAKQKAEKLHAFQAKLGSLKFLDPACGSGNFLTETYLSLRRLENKVISILNKGEKVFGFDEFIKVHINQFYGIEINDFAVTVAKTALWIAESQMIAETEAILSQSIDFLPLKTGANIIEANALRMDWSTLKVNSELGMRNDELLLFSGFTTETDGTKHEYDYIMGNPPFVGARLMSESQKADVALIWQKAKNLGNLDYVSCWYKKAADLIKGTTTKAALVSTNSITQGEQVALMWKPLFEESGIQIDFAWRTFRWDSESTEKAHVHCVIVGFSCKKEEQTDLFAPNGTHPNKEAKSVSSVQIRLLIKKIYNPDGTFVEAKNINGYLLDAPNIFVESRSKPLCAVPEIGIGNKPIDGGNYLFTEDEMQDFIKKEPASEKYFHKWLGSDEFINRYYRYCLWLGDCSPAEIKKMPECFKRVQAVRELRLASKSVPTQKLADTPTRFHVENFPKGTYIVVPEVSSEKRYYIPMGFLTPDIFCSNLVKIIPDASLYHFGVLTSSVHNAWVRAVCGRLETRYRYSKDIVYNNFPFIVPEMPHGFDFANAKSSETKNGKSLDFPNPCGNLFCTPEQAAKIEATAQAILDARAKYPDSSLADLYDETLMPADLRKAHRENDKAVMTAYGFKANMTESEIVGELFKMYAQVAKATS